MNSSILIFKNAASAAGSFANTAFIICLVLGFVCLALAVLFFFLFDIPRVYLLRTGKGARKTIKKMEEINAQTGRLRRVNEEYMLSEDAPLTGEIGHTPSHDIGASAQRSEENATTVLGQRADENATTVLGKQIETTVLSNSETTVLNSGMVDSAATNAYSYQRKTTGKFDVVTSIVMTHSDEII